MGIRYVYIITKDFSKVDMEFMPEMSKTKYIFKFLLSKMSKSLGWSRDMEWSLRE